MKNSFEQAKSPERKTISRVRSELETVDGVHEELPVATVEDGMPKAVAFFDIDHTLADLTFIHGEAIRKLFPDQDPQEVADTFFAGFKLGNSFREFDRMLGIYEDGKTAWKDPEIYLKEQFVPHEKEIDEPGNALHDRAAQYAGRYSAVAGEAAKEIYEKEPSRFEDAKIQPLFRLAGLYKRLGIPMMGMTANGKEFTTAAAKYLNLSDVFIDIATDETMEGGGKEVAMERLIDELEKKGIRVPKDRLVVVGDSLRGDIGSASRLASKDGAVRSQGILILEDKNALSAIQAQIAGDRELQKIVSDVDTNGLVIEDVPISENGKPLLGSAYRDAFLTKL